MVVDGQWTQLRKYRAARSLSPLCALCGSEEGSLTHRHVRCSEVLDVEPRNMPGPFYSAAQSGSLWKHESFASRALLPALKGRPPGHTVPRKRAGKVTAACSQELSTETAQLTRDKTQTSALRVGSLVANTAAEQPVSVSGTLPHPHPRCRRGRALRPLHVPSNCARRRSTSRTAALLEQGVNQRGRKATEASTSAWADLWRDVWREIDAWGGLGDSLSVRKVKAHTAPEAVCAGVISAEDRAGNDLADAACKLVVLEHRAPRSIRAARHSANLAVTCIAHWIARTWFCEAATGH